MAARILLAGGKETWDNVDMAEATHKHREHAELYGGFQFRAINTFREALLNLRAEEHRQNGRRALFLCTNVQALESPRLVASRNELYKQAPSEVLGSRLRARLGHIQASGTYAVAWARDAGPWIDEEKDALVLPFDIQIDGRTLEQLRASLKDGLSEELFGKAVLRATHVVQNREMVSQEERGTVSRRLGGVVRSGRAQVGHIEWVQRTQADVPPQNRA